MSKTVAQIYATNPTTTVADTDLYYLVQSPYTPGSDAAITGLSLKAAFGSGGTINPGLINQLGYYAAAGSTISGLATLASGTLITSAAGLPSISQTLPSAVQGNITALGTIATGVWNGSVITGTYGGTGVNNGASTFTMGGSHTLSGAFASTFTFTNTTSVTFPTSGTLATTSQLLVSPLTTKGDIWVWSTTNDRLPVATGDGKILQVLASAATGLAYSTATYPVVATSTGSFIYANGTNYVASTSLWPNTVGTAGKIVRSDGTINAYTTSTFADTYSASTLLYSNGANTVTGLTTANNGLLVTSSAGVPSILAGPGTTGNFLQSNAAAAPSFSTSTITLGGNFTTSGAFTTTLTVTGNTNVTLPTSGTLSNIANAFSQVNTQTITATGAFTYTPTTGTKYAIFELQAGGGGSGGTTSASNQGGTAGAASAGNYLKILVTGTSNLAAISGSVGIAGTAGSSGANSGGTGGNTTLTINGGTQWVATGGVLTTGGSANAGATTKNPAAAPAANTIGTNGTTIENLIGGTGGTSTVSAAGSNPRVDGTGGVSRNTYYGKGGDGQANISSGNQAGNAGIQGIVIVTEFISV